MCCVRLALWECVLLHKRLCIVPEGKHKKTMKKTNPAATGGNEILFEVQVPVDL
jgi:hypothetical protein